MISGTRYQVRYHHPSLKPFEHYLITGKYVSILNSHAYVEGPRARALHTTYLHVLYCCVWYYYDCIPGTRHTPHNRTAATTDTTTTITHTNTEAAARTTKKGRNKCRGKFEYSSKIPQPGAPSIFSVCIYGWMVNGQTILVWLTADLYTACCCTQGVSILRM